MTTGQTSDDRTFVTDLNLDFARPLADVPVRDGDHSVWTLVRLHGCPMGSVLLPAAAGRCSATVLLPAIVDALSVRILRHLLVDRLLTDGLPASLTPQMLLDAGHASEPGTWPSVTVAVCTRGRPDDLRRCLAALTQLEYAGPLDLLVVDNAPSDSSVETATRAYGQVRYVREDRPGLDWARNRAIGESTSDIVAFTDDDTTSDPGWLRALVAPFRWDRHVQATAGLVVPLELETAAQRLFEDHGGLGRGFTRRWLRVERGALVSRALNVTTIGTGANMAFRRSIFAELGRFDVALDAGTPATAGGDTEMFFRILKAGCTIVYEPAALVRHRHRPSADAVRAQLMNWLTGVHAALTAMMRRYPDERAGLVAFLVRLCTLHYPWRFAKSLLPRSRLHAGLVMGEIQGLLRGFGRYDDAIAAAARVAGASQELPLPAGPLRQSRSGGRTVDLRVDIAQPLPQVLPESQDADRVRISVQRGGSVLGRVAIMNGGAPVNARQLGDAIAAELALTLVNRGAFTRGLRSGLAKA